MKPTVGRIVHYWITDAYGNIIPRPAIITQVWSDDCVNLHVFGDGSINEEDIKPTSVCQGEEISYCWSWPKKEG